LVGNLGLESQWRTG